MSNDRVIQKYIRFVDVNRSLSDALKIYTQRVKDALEVYEKFNSEFVNRKCPVCGSVNDEVVGEFHESYQIVRCETCASNFVNPSPSLEVLEYYYNKCDCNNMLGEVYRKRTNTGNPILSGRAVSVINIIKDMLDSGREKKIKILEVGCSSGVFLSELKFGLSQNELLDKCELVGIDIDNDAVNKSVDPELCLIASPIEKYALNNDQTFDLVVHFELIEHLVDPFDFMQSIHKLLKSNGVHYFHTPNALGMDNVALGWNSTRLLAHSIFPPMHLNSFTTQNILLFSYRAGFAVKNVETTGMLDVDIVKMMSDEIDKDSPFSLIDQFDDDQLAIVQLWLKELCASSHMSVTLKKN